MSNSLQPHELQHSRPPCPSPTPGVYANSCPLSWWCHPTISSSVIPFSSCPQSFPASGSFPNESALLIRWPKYWSFSFNISPSDEHSGLISFRMDWLDLLTVHGDSQESSPTPQFKKVSILQCSAFFIVQLSRPYMMWCSFIYQSFIEQLLCVRHYTKSWRQNKQKPPKSFPLCSDILRGGMRGWSGRGRDRQQMNERGMYMRV